MSIVHVHSDAPSLTDDHDVTLRWTQLSWPPIDHVTAALTNHSDCGLCVRGAELSLFCVAVWHWHSLLSCIITTVTAAGHVQRMLETSLDNDGHHPTPSLMSMLLLLGAHYYIYYYYYYFR